MKVSEFSQEIVVLNSPNRFGVNVFSPGGIFQFNTFHRVSIENAIPFVDGSCEKRRTCVIQNHEVYLVGVQQPCKLADER